MATLRDALDTIRKLSKDDYEELLKRLMHTGHLPTGIDSYLTDIRFSGGRKCPHCSGTHICRNGKTKSGRQRYICRDCGKTFVITTNSILSGTTKSLYTWRKYIALMMQGASLRWAAAECKICKNTAFNWRHKILDALQSMAVSVVLDGIVEADETYFSTSFKGNHTKSAFTIPRKPHKRGCDVHKRGISKEKVCVSCAVNREGLSIAKSSNLARPTVADFHKVFDNRIDDDAVICTDKLAAYAKFAKDNGLDLVQIKGGKASKGIYNIQNINSYHSRLKKFIERFNGVSSKYLDNYLIWNNYVNYTKGILIEKKEKLIEFVCSVYLKERCRDISSRPTFSF